MVCLPDPDSLPLNNSFQLLTIYAIDVNVIRTTAAVLDDDGPP